MTYAQYAAIAGHNFSTIKHMAESPRAYRLALDSTDDGDTAARALLRYQHALILEPDAALLDFVMWEGSVRRGKEWDAFAAENVSRSIVGYGTDAQRRDVDAARRIAAVAANHPLVRRILDDPATRCELPVFGIDAVTGLPIKSRQDIYNPVWWLDVKDWGTTDNRKCGRLAYQNLNIHQAAHNRRCIIAAGLPVPMRWGFVCLDAKHQDVAIYEIAEHYLDAADIEITRWLERIRECEQSGEWPGRQTDGPEMLDLPGYAFAPKTDDFTFDIGE